MENLIDDFNLIKASPYTKLFWTEYQINSENSDFNIILDQTICGDLDLVRLSESLHNLVDNFVLLNSHLVSIDGTLYWEKNSNISILEIFENTDYEKEFVEKPFNLKTGPLYRFGIFKISENKYDFIIASHYAVMDTSVCDQFLTLISQYYSSDKILSIDKIKQNKKIKKFNSALWDQLKSIDQDNANRFWNNILNNAKPKNNLPYFRSDNIGTDIYSFSIEKKALDLSILHKSQTTLFTFLSSVFGFMMSQYCNSTNFIMANLFSVSPITHFIYGRQSNILLLPIHINRSSTVKTFLNETIARIENCIMDSSRGYCYFLTEGNISNSNISKLDIFFGKADLRDTKLIFENCNIKINKRYNIDTLGSELMLDYNDSAEEIKFDIKYDKSLFSNDFIMQIAAEFCHLLEYMTNKENTEQKLSKICLLTELEHKKIVYDWNKTIKKYQDNKTIHALFEEQVAINPDDIAIKHENLSLSYKELNYKANQIANYIIEHQNIIPETLVALYLDRSEFMLIAILAVLKSGAAYVPIDINYPDERVKYILEDTDAKTILTTKKYQAKLHKMYEDKHFGSEFAVLNIEDMNKDGLDISSYNPITKVTSSNLAYIIYTSGTSGRPKGVMIEHKGVVNLALSHADAFGLATSKNKHCLCYANYVFDAHVSEIYSSLLFGHTLHIINDDIKQNIALLSQYINFNNIFIGTIPPALLDNQTILKLDTMVVAGDKTPQEILDKYQLNGVKIINAYGPTEVTVCSSLNHYDNNGATNIGKPISNTIAYVLSDELEPLPPGIVGELYIGGVGLARGYLNNSELTAKKFINNPFITEENRHQYHNDKLYQTGDLACWLPDGNLEYVGRNDFQIKIRGYRIEPREIEVLLTNYSGIRQSIVIAKENINDFKKHTYLVGYYVAEHPLDKNDILNYLQLRLPSYMVPAQLIYIEKLPMTINGKINYGELPAVEVVNSTNYTAPRNEIENCLCEIYAEVLDLPIASVGIRDDLFRLGGDSIVIIQLISRIKKRLGIEITIQNIFDHRSIENLYDNLLKQELYSNTKISLESSTIKNQPYYEEDSIDLNHKKQSRKCLAVHDVGNIVSKEYLDKLQQNNEIENIYLANSLQQGFIYHYISQAEIDNAYRVQLTWEYKAYINLDLLKEAWALAQKKFCCLRLRLAWDEIFIQIIDKKADLNWKVIDLSLESISSQKDKIKDLQQKDNQEKFILENGSLFRIYIIKQKRDLYTCIFSNHHAILDGWSIPILLNYVHDSYLKLLSNQDVDISVDYSYQNTQKYIQEKKGSTKEYWAKYLHGIEANDHLDLLIDKSQTVSINDYKYIKDRKVQECIIQGSIYYELKHISKIEGVTTNAILQYVWHKVLSIYCNNNQTIVGTIVSGRTLPIDNIENSVGLYINTLPLIVSHDSSRSIIENIKVIQYDINEISTNSNINLVELQQGGKRLFNSLFVYENYPARTGLFSHEYHQTPTDSWQYMLQVEFKDSLGNVDYPLCVMVSEVDNCVVFKVGYASELFTDSVIESLLSTFQTILGQIKQNNIKNKPSTLIYLSEKQYDKIIKWSCTPGAYSQNKTIHQLFEEQVERTPESIALVSQNRRISYQDFNNKANQLMHYLNNIHPSDPGSLMAICMERDESFLITMLAILKAGCAYVPINMSSPDERIKYILENSKVSIIFTSTKYQERIERLIESNIFRETSRATVINISTVQNKIDLQLKTSNLTKVTSNCLAYVMYTSGTTGKPKGVMIEHRGVVSLVKNINYVDINSNDNFIQLADIAFDAATFEIWAPLLNGAKLCIPCSQIDLFSDIKLLKKILSENKISILWLTKSLFDQLFLSDQNLFKDLKYLLIGGEPLDKRLICKLVNLSTAPKKIINGYGPTENTSFSCTSSIKEINITNLCSIPIGKPLSNRAAYVLSNDLSLLPIGATGELYLSGSGLARGYLNNSKLTMEKFIANPFLNEGEQVDNNDRLYKTGDLVRWLSNGNLEYIGRNDSQVKISGYRIELKEIENILLVYPGITQCAVLLRELVTHDGSCHKYLVAYYVSEKEFDNDSIISYLQNILPEYMVPSVLIYLDKIPINANGKLNYPLLFSYDDTNFSSNNNYYAPRNELEKQICQIWAEVLGLHIDKLGIKDDFFRLGGNSILSIKLITKLNNFLRKSRKVSYEIRLASFLRAKTIENVVALFDAECRGKKPGINLFKRDVILHSSIQPLPQDKQHLNKKENIFLTGATGLLGAYILFNLLKLDNGMVYCLIRAESMQEAFEKLKQNFNKYNLDHNCLNNEKLKITIGDFGKANFSMKYKDYYNLANEIDIIIHNGAEVNHIYPYELLRDANVKSTKHMLKFASTNKQKDINYVSTLSVTSCINQHSGSIKDNSICDINSINLDHGYLSTKLASEILLKEADNRGFNINIFRPGFLFSKENGIYKFASNNHLYSFITSLIQFEKYPNTNFIFNIAPVDFVSFVITNVMLDNSSKNNIFNFINSNKLSLDALINNLKLRKFKLEKVSLDEWHSLIQNIDENNNLFKFSSLYSAKFDDMQDNSSNYAVQAISKEFLDKIGLAYPTVLPEEIVEGIIYKFNK